MHPADLRARVERWITDDPDPETRAELGELLTRPDIIATDLADRFAGSLQFGTAGLRGVIGAGPNRMNRAVVARATWALAREIKARVPRALQRPVVVGGDARRMSRELADDVAAILAAQGLHVILFPHPVPTPLVGFAVKQLKAAGGVVITASHNPAEYNGYKVYWERAAQIIPPIDAWIASSIDQAPPARAVPRPPLETLRAAGKVAPPPPDVEGEYIEAVAGLCVHPDAGDRALQIVYTPLHGVGGSLVRKALARTGFTSVMTVAAQQVPDPTFPTVAFPNPEEAGALDCAVALAIDCRADLVLANDPDADRLAVAVPETSAGHAYRHLTGNEVGVLLGYYLLTERPKTPKKRAVVASIVSSPLLGRIARDLDVHYEETLTGFKWIANRAIELEADGFEFVLGYEEAIGYSVGGAVRDKDGISAAVVVAEYAAILRERGQTLIDALDAIARKWGVFMSAQVGLTRTGVRGAAAIRTIMEQLRAHPPRQVANDEVVAILDYSLGRRTDLRAPGVSTPLVLPPSDVLALELASGGRIVARPSGTEPKAKFYFDVFEPVGPEEHVAAAESRARASMQGLVDAFGRLTCASKA